MICFQLFPRFRSTPLRVLVPQMEIDLPPFGLGTGRREVASRSEPVLDGGVFSDRALRPPGQNVCQWTSPDFGAVSLDKIDLLGPLLLQRTAKTGISEIAIDL